VAAVVDAGGALLFLWRPDAAQVASVEVATDKARTAAIYRRPSKDFADRMASGNTTTLALPEVIPLEGGLPIVVDGQVIGAIAASGAQAVQDAQAAQAGIDALLRKLGR
jgi:glc operon protein GlcG